MMRWLHSVTHTLIFHSDEHANLLHVEYHYLQDPYHRWSAVLLLCSAIRGMSIVLDTLRTAIRATVLQSVYRHCLP